jgi:hypothetical protein
MIPRFRFPDFRADYAHFTEKHNRGSSLERGQISLWPRKAVLPRHHSPSPTKQKQIMNYENKKPLKPLLRPVAALQHYVANTSIAILH